MKRNTKEKDNWMKFREIFDCVSTGNDDTHVAIMDLIPALDKFLSLAPSIIFIIDYSTMQYLYFNENMNDFLGDVGEDYLKKGIAFALANTHPDDREKLTSQFFPYIKNFLSKVPSETYKDYKFSFNFRYQRKDGAYQAFIQHSTYIADKAGNLRYNFGLGTNLSVPNEDKITLTIEKKAKGNYKTVNIETITINSENIFTNREHEVLFLIHQGLSSTAIAKKLCISEHTVNNHRKNMLKKSGTSNTAALINYVQKRGII